LTTAVLRLCRYASLVALLALSAFGTARAASPVPEAAPQYGLTAIAGAHRRDSYAFAETQLGRLTPGSRPTGAIGLSIVSDDGLEVLLPGRIGWRLSNAADTELVPWLGVPLYLLKDSQGRHVPWFGVGAGLDLWYHPISPFAIGVNVGLLGVGDGDPTLYGAARVWAAAGFSWRLRERVTISLGAGYARNTSDEPTRSLNADQRAEKLGFGSVLSDGIRQHPALAVELSRALTLGLNVRIDYVPDEKLDSANVAPIDEAPPLPDPQSLGGPVGYEAALVVVYTINPR
jgi:hypothetical protein